VTPPRLLVITDRRQAGRPLAEVVAAVCAAGCPWVSLREKDLSPDEQVALAQALLPIAREHNVRLTLHGDPEIAVTAGLDGVHLPARSDVGANRAVLGSGFLGLSIHTPGEAAAIDADRVDYVIAGPVYASASKPGYGPVLGIAGLAGIVALSPVPVFAIGGIEPATVADVMATGVAGIAVMGSVMRAADPGGAVRALLAALEAAQRPR
jgi:thiamine-phosphate pyrophosphorylase